MNHADEHVDSRLSSDVVVLIHSGPVGARVSPFQLDQTDVVGYGAPKILQPVPDDVIQRENDVRTLFMNPLCEEVGIVCGGLHCEKWSQLLGFGKVLLSASVSGAEAVLDQLIDGFIQYQTGSLIPEFKGLFEGSQGQDVMIDTGKRKGWISGADARHNRWKVFDQGQEVFRYTILFHEADQDESPDSPGFQDIDPAVRIGIRLMKPEGVQGVAELSGPSSATFHVLRNGGVFLKGAGISVRIEQSQRCLGRAMALESHLRHQLAIGRVPLVTELGGNVKDFIAGCFGNGRMIS